MSGARFRYPLEPLLRMRQWELDAMRRELGEVNAAREQAERHSAERRAEVERASAEWQALAQAEAPLTVQRFTLLAGYIGDVEQQARAAADALTQCEAQRDALIEQVLAMQLKVDAVEDHRAQMRDDFVKLRLSGQFKQADDQWNTLEARRE